MMHTVPVDDSTWAKFLFIKQQLEKEQQRKVSLRLTLVHLIQFYLDQKGKV